MHFFTPDVSKMITLESLPDHMNLAIFWAARLNFVAQESPLRTLRFTFIIRLMRLFWPRIRLQTSLPDPDEIAGNPVGQAHW